MYQRVHTVGIVFLLSILLFSGCSTFIDIRSEQNLFRNSQYQQAYDSMLMQASDILKAQGSIVVNLDLGILARLQSSYEESNRYFSEAERRIQEAYTESVSANIASFIVNENTREYQGEDYEDIYINVFKALNYIHLGQAESALVELRRSIEKQANLKQKYEKQSQQLNSYAAGKGYSENGTYASSYSSSALANFLAMVVAKSMGEQNTYTYSLAQVDHAFAVQPGLYPFPVPSLFKDETYEAKQKELYVVAFNGIAPEKREQVESVYVSRNNFAKVAYPILVGKTSAVKGIRVIANGRTEQLQRLESISSIAIDTFMAKAALTRMKAILRSMTKSIGIAAYDHYAEQDNQVTAGEEILGWLFKIARNVSETADVRSSHFLPSEAWVGRIELKGKAENIRLEFLNASGSVIYTQHIASQEANKDSVNLIEAYCPL